MGMSDVLKNHKAVENPEFGDKKKLIGDAVAQVQSFEKIVGKKTGKEWLMLKCEAIHAIPDPKGRETTIKAGDELVKMYDPNDGDSIADMDNDLFTAGIEYNKEGEDDAVVASIAEAAKGKLIYFRTWAKDKTEEQLAKNPSPSYWQNINIKSKNLITPENSTPELPF